MSRETELTFECLFLLEDIRQVLRDTAPAHKFSAEQKKKVKELITKVKKNLDEIQKICGD